METSKINDLRALYGAAAVFTNVDRFTLVHMDQPSQELINKRAREVSAEEFFCPDCPLCQMLKEAGVVVFDDSLEAAQ